MMFRFLALICFVVFSFSAQAEGRVLSTSEKQLVEKLRTVLNEMKTLQGSFAQISSSGEYGDGKVYLSRPGQMRLIYNEPLKSEIIVRNDTIIYHDKEFRQVTYYPLSATPLHVLLQDDFSFEKDVEIIDLAEDRGVIELTLVDREDPGMGSVTLVFSKAPMELRKWAVVDAQGIMTQVSLLNAQIGQPIDPEHFKFTDPEYDKRNR